MFRAVLDTNVWVSAVTAPVGLCSTLLLEWSSGSFEPVVSDELLDELRDVLTRPKFSRVITLEEADAYVRYVAEGCPVFPDTLQAIGRSRDPEDDYLFELAITSGAVVIVTGDRDLRTVEDPPVPVLTPRAFLESLPA